MAIKFSQFNLRTESTPTMYLVGYDGNQNIHITVDNLLNNFINGTENTIAMFGPGGNNVIDSMLSQNAGATILTIGGQLNVDAAATFDTSITVTGNSTLNGNVTLGNASTDLITQTGTLYLNGPVKDTTDTLGDADQILVSDANGELTFTDLTDITVGSAEVVQVPVKNLEGSPLTKGDPVYISGSVGASGRLEVKLADASNEAKMPALGLLKQDLGINGTGFAVVTGKLRNLPTDPIDGQTPLENDVIYVKANGTTGAALTLTKPTGSNLIQNMGKVGRVSTSNDGTFVVSSILRTNDIPNLTPGKIWVGSTGNTIESSSITFTEATGAVQLNEYGAGTITGTATYNLSVDASGNVIETTAVPANIVETLTAASGTYISFTDASAATGGVDLGTFDLSAVDGTSTTATRFLSKDNTWEVPSYTTINTTDGTYINLTPNTATGGAVTITADISAVDGTAVANERYLTKNNTWAEVDTIPGTYTFDVTADGGIPQTILSGETLDIAGGTYITTSVGGTNTVTISHDLTVRTDTASAQSPGYGGTFTAVDSISTNTQGHLTAVNLKTVTMPSADDTNTTYDLLGVGGVNGTAGVRLAGSDATNDDVLIVGAGTTGVVRAGNTLTVTSNDQYTGTVTSVGTSAPLTGGTITSTGTIGITQATTTTDGYLSSTDWNTFNNKQGAITNPVTGTGTANYVSKWTSSSAQGNSTIYDNGTNVGIGTTSLSARLEVQGGTTTSAVAFSGPTVKIGDYAGIGNTRIFSNGSYIGYSTNNSYHDFSNTGSSQMRITSTGNVGIGTTSPDYPLTVSGLAQVAGALRITETGTAQRILIGNQDSGGVNNPSIIEAANGHLYFGNGDSWNGEGGSHSIKMTVLDGGNVGIGTTSPSAQLHLSKAGGTLIKLGTSQNTSEIEAREVGSANSLVFSSNNSVDHMTIDGVGNVGIGLTGPQAKLHVRKATGPLSSFNSNTVGIFENSGPGYVNIVTGATSTGELWFSDSSEGRGRVRYNHSDDSLQFWVANDEKLRVGVNGQIGVEGANYGTAGNVLTSNGSGSAPSWQAAGGGSYTPNIVSGATTASKDNLYIFTASATLTLPASPSGGDSIKVSNLSGTTTCVIARNGSNIMAVADNMTLDNQYASFELIYGDATRGWVVVGGN